MRRKLAIVAVGGLAVAMLLEWTRPTARAIPQFKKEFDTLYVKVDSTDPNEKALAEAVDKAKCDVCHVPKKPKKMRNRYGEALSELLDYKADKANKEKIIEALHEVEKMKCDKEDENSLTFGELIVQGKLPGGDGEAAGADAAAGGSE